MPHDPRTGYYGHQLSPRDQQQQVRPDDSTSSARGRRRRALGDDGTGGTRVIDLLSKHGKTPGPSTGSHRRHAEPPAPGPTNGAHANGSSANGSHGLNGFHANGSHANGSHANGSHANGSHSLGADTNGPSYPRLVPPSAERSRPGIPPAEPRQELQAPPPDATRPAVSRPRLPRVTPPPLTADSRPAPPPTPPPAAPPAAEPRPSIPPTAAPAAASWTPPGTQRGLRPVPPERRGEPRRPGETPSGRWPRPAPPRPNGFAVRGGVAAASGAAIRQPDVGDPEATRIAEALSGKLAAPPEAPQRGARRPEPPQPARPGRPAPVPPAQDPQGPARGAAELAPPPKGPTENRNSAAEDVAPDADWDLDDDVADWGEDKQANSDEVKAIDATLARFSAVHDQLAEEEAARRKRYSWLMGKRKEPELGQDMPFDFVEGRDSQASRLEWKKKRRKRKVQRILLVVGVIAVLAVAAVFALHWLA